MSGRRDDDGGGSLQRVGWGKAKRGGDLRFTKTVASPIKASKPSTCTTESRVSSYRPPWMLSAALLMTAIKAFAASFFLCATPLGFSPPFAFTSSSLRSYKRLSVAYPVRYLCSVAAASVSSSSSFLRLL